MHRTVYINILKPKTQFIYYQFNLQKTEVLPTQCIYVFCAYLRTNSDYFSMQHHLIGFTAEAESVRCAVRTVSSNQTVTALGK